MAAEPRYDALGRAICCDACLIGLNGEDVVLKPRPFCGHRLCPTCLSAEICDRCHTAATRPGSWEAYEERRHAARCGCNYCRILRDGCDCAYGCNEEKTRALVELRKTRYDAGRCVWCGEPASTTAPAGCSSHRAPTVEQR